MAVWVPTDESVVAAQPTPTVASQGVASASHCWGQDSERAINDLREPSSSGDESIPRLTWWDHRGTEEWAQLTWSDRQNISGVRVYFFDDTGKGQCRVPASWRVVYWSRGEWKPVVAHGEYEVKKDGYSEVTFDPVTTDSLRVEVELQEGYSGGILEMETEYEPYGR